MHTPRATFALLMLAAGFATSVHSQTSLTREQVKAELAEAIRTGNVMANGGESGLTMRELYPQLYPASQATATPATRAQVLAELKEAQRTGDIYAAGDSGLRLNELNPDAYPPKAVAQGKTRAQVQAELREAVRTGNVLASGETGLLLKDLNPQRYANVTPAADVPMQALSASGVTVR